MKPIKDWDFRAWIMLFVGGLNAYTFITTGSVLALIFGVLCCMYFYDKVTK